MKEEERKISRHENTTQPAHESRNGSHMSPENASLLLLAAMLMLVVSLSTLKRAGGHPAASQALCEDLTHFRDINGDRKRRTSERLEVQSRLDGHDAESRNRR